MARRTRAARDRKLGLLPNRCPTAPDVGRLSRDEGRVSSPERPILGEGVYCCIASTAVIYGVPVQTAACRPVREPRAPQADAAITRTQSRDRWRRWVGPRPLPPMARASRLDHGRAENRSICPPWVRSNRRQRLRGRLKDSMRDIGHSGELIPKGDPPARIQPQDHVLIEPDSGLPRRSYNHLDVVPTEPPPVVRDGHIEPK